MKVAALQMTSGPDVDANLATAQALLADAAAAGARLAALPENFAFMGLEDADKRKVAEEEGEGPIQAALAESARRLELWIVAGTIPLRLPGEGRVAAASFLGDAIEFQVAVNDSLLRLKVHPSTAVRQGDVIRFRLPAESCRALSS